MDPFCFIYIPVVGIILGVVYMVGVLMGPSSDSDSSNPNLQTLVLGVKIISTLIYRLSIRLLTLFLLPIEKIWILSGHDSYTFKQAVRWRLQIMKARYFCTEIDKLNARIWLAPILGNRKVVDFCNQWKDGIVLCQVMYRIFPANDLKPSTLKSEGAYRRISFALQCARDRLFVQTSVTPKDVLTLTPETEYILLELLMRIQVACAMLGIDTNNLKSPTLDSLSDEDDAKNELVLVDGPGLQSGRVGEPACFTIEFYTRYLDVVVDIRGSCGEFRTRRITNRSPRRKVETGSLDSTPIESDNDESSAGEQPPSRTDNNIRFEYEIFNNIVNVTYYPRNTGVYEIKIFFMGRIVTGSPFRPLIHDKSAWLPSPKSTPPLLRSRSSSEERFRCYSWSHSVSPVKPFKRRIVKQVVNIGDEKIEVLPQEGISISEAMRNKINDSKRSVSFEDDGLMAQSQETARRSSLTLSPLRTDKYLHLDLKQRIRPQLEDIAQSPVTDSSRQLGDSAGPASDVTKASPFESHFSPITIKSFDSLLDIVKAAQEKKSSGDPGPVENAICSQTEADEEENRGTESEEGKIDLIPLVEGSDPSPGDNTDSKEKPDSPYSVDHVNKDKPVLDCGDTDTSYSLVPLGGPESLPPPIHGETKTLLNSYREGRKSSLQATTSESSVKLRRQYSLTLDSLSCDDVTRITVFASENLAVKDADDFLGKVDCNSNLRQTGANSLCRDFLVVNMASERDLMTPVEDAIPIKTYPILGIDETVVQSELEGPIKPRVVFKCHSQEEITHPLAGDSQVRKVCYKAAREESIDNSLVPANVDELFDRIYSESSGNNDEANYASNEELLSSPGSSSSWVLLEAPEGESPSPQITLQIHDEPDQNAENSVYNSFEGLLKRAEQGSEELGQWRSDKQPVSTAKSSEMLTKVSLMTNFEERPTSELVLIPTPEGANRPPYDETTAVTQRKRFGLTPLNSLEEDEPENTTSSHSDTTLLCIPHGNSLSTASSQRIEVSEDQGLKDVESMSSLFIPPMKEKHSNVQSAQIRVNEFVNDLARQLGSISDTRLTYDEDPCPESSWNSETNPIPDNADGEVTRKHTSFLSSAHHYGNDVTLQSRMEDMNGDTYLIVESFERPFEPNVVTPEPISKNYSSSDVETLVASCDDLDCVNKDPNPQLKTTSCSNEPPIIETAKPAFPSSSGKAGFLGVKPYTETDRVLPTSSKISRVSCVHNLTPTPFKPFVIEAHVKKVSPVISEDVSVQCPNSSDPKTEGGNDSASPVAVLDLSDFVLLENGVSSTNTFRKFNTESPKSIPGGVDKESQHFPKSSEDESQKTDSCLSNETRAIDALGDKGEALGLTKNLVEVSVTSNQSHDTQDLIESKIVKARRQYWDRVSQDGLNDSSSTTTDNAGTDECHLDISKARQMFEAAEVLSSRNVSSVRKVSRDIPPWMSDVLEEEKVWKSPRSLQSDSLCFPRTDDMSILTPNVLDVSRSYPTFYSSPSTPLSSSPRQSSSFRRKIETWEARTSPVPSRPTSRNISYEQHISEMNKLTSSVTEWENKAKQVPPTSVIPNVTPKLDRFLSSSSVKSGSSDSSSSRNSDRSVCLTPQSSTDSEDPPIINVPLFKKSQPIKLKQAESDEDSGESPLRALRYPEDFLNDYPYLPKNTLCSRRRFTPGTQVDLISLNNLNNYL